MIVTDYYKFAKLTSKGKTRLDCVESTKSYNPFEDLRNRKTGELFIYAGDNVYIKADAKRKTDIGFSKGKHITSLYTPNPTNSILWRF